MKKSRILLLAFILGSSLAIVVSGLIANHAETNKILALSIAPIDFTIFPDGKYTGKFSGRRYFCAVTTSIYNQKVEAISLSKVKMLPSDKRANSLIESILRNQSFPQEYPDNDSLTAKIILKAIANGFKQH